MKKGAFDLSVNAIVILILAIIMLGLGVTFIKNMFGKTSSQFEELISAENEPPSAFHGEPITLSREHIITTSGDTEVLKVSVFNSWGAGSSTPGTPTTVTQSKVAGATSADLCGVPNDGVCFYDAVGGAGCNSWSPPGESGGSDCPTSFACGTFGDGYCNINAGDPNCNIAAMQDPATTKDDDCVETVTVAPDSATGGSNATVEIICPSHTQLNDAINQSHTTQKKIIEPGQTATLTYIFDTGSTAAGTYLCEVRLEGRPSYATDLVIDIKR